MMTIEEIEAAHENSQPIPAGDVVYARMQYPLTRMLYPLGFPLEISTNSQEVLDVAVEGWGAFTQLFQTPPIRIQVGVLDGGSVECPPAPRPRVQQHLFSVVADHENYGLIDMAQGFAGLWLTREAVKHHSYLRHFFLECAIVCPIATRFVTGVHAACVERNGVGVLLCGDSGAGKSTLAYGCAKAGWTYITDDGSYMVHGSDGIVVTGNCHQVRFRPSAASVFPEIAGREITQRAQVGKPSIELAPATLPGIRCSQTATIQYVIFLNRRCEDNLPLRPYSKEVVRKFLRQARFSPMDRMPEHYAAIDKLLELDVLELRYNDIGWAVEQLESLVENGAP
jgi:hypothetical protein